MEISQFSLFGKLETSQIRICRAAKSRREKFLPTRVPAMSTSSCVSPGLRRYPVKTSTWVTRCSGSAHRSGGSPEAFIVLQVYCDRPGSGRPHRRPIRLPRGRPPHFPSRLFAWLPSHPRNVCLGPCTHANLRKWKSLKSITTLFRESISAIRLKIIFWQKKNANLHTSCIKR